MNILVCVKQVADMDALTVSETAGGRATMDEPTSFHMNRYDEYALEAALQIQEGFALTQPVRIDALTAGPDRCFDVIKRAVGMGAQAGIHLRPRVDADPDPAAVAAGIARYAQSTHYELILTGSMSEDGMHGQVGPRLAAHLNWPCATTVVSLQLDPARCAVTIEKEIEKGARLQLKLRLPAVLSLQSGINQPRYPSLSNLLRANRQPVHSLPLEGDQPGAPVPRSMGMVMPRRSRSGRMLEGTPEEKAAALATILRERAFLS
ncbi:EtfB7: electron transfer flavoprotein, subunit beta [Desulfosarcina variabilis str. Montpellier]|uniref:electron transfer flavoprotein subunit beta/FixA family protein n=1 Tax=Desulfosarcina variabilis TaxID=2300 RepID=UPI003AFA04BE